MNATLHVLLYSHEDYLRQLGCSARGRWHTAICTLRQNILRAPGVVDSDALVQLLLDVKEGKSPLRRDPNSNRKLEQADAMELRDHIMSKLVKEVSLWVCWLCPGTVSCACQVKTLEGKLHVANVGSGGAAESV